MDFIEYANNWAKSEVIQGQIMIGIGVLFLAAFIGILRSEVEFLRGSLVPIALIILMLIGYGGYILSSRPAHVRQSIERYQQSANEAIKLEKAKHINDNKTGKTLMKIYPLLAIGAIVALMLIPSPYSKGMAMGFAVLFLATYIMDNGFVTRSDAFLQFLGELKP